MQELESQLRKWGRSIGVVIPSEAVKKEGLKEGSTVKLIVLNKTSALEETFGMLKLKKSTDKILEEIDEEGWSE